MPEPIDLLIEPNSFPSEEEPLTRLICHEPVFLRGEDSFERWVSRRNYELGRPPLSSDEIAILRRRWRQ